MGAGKARQTKGLNLRRESQFGMEGQLKCHSRPCYADTCFLKEMETLLLIGNDHILS